MPTAAGLDAERTAEAPSGRPDQPHRGADREPGDSPDERHTRVRSVLADAVGGSNGPALVDFLDQVIRADHESGDPAAAVRPAGDAAGEPVDESSGDPAADRGATGQGDASNGVDGTTPPGDIGARLAAFEPMGSPPEIDQQSRPDSTPPPGQLVRAAEKAEADGLEQLAADGLARLADTAVEYGTSLGETAELVAGTAADMADDIGGALLPAATVVDAVLNRDAYLAGAAAWVADARYQGVHSAEDYRGRHRG